MGTWGYGLYQNDTALDVRDIFEALYNKGKNAREITDILLDNFKSVMNIFEEHALLWLALADTQWSYGVLLEDVKEQALKTIVECHSILQRADDREVDKGKVKNVLDKLHAKLLSPQPEPKKHKRRRIYVCQWKRGDVFAYQLESKQAEERGLLGRYFLIQKVGESTWYPGHVIPIVYVKITEDATLPSSIEEYNRLEYVQTGFTKYENRFFPIDGRCPQEDIARKSKMKYEVDEYGFLPEYRVRLIATSERDIPSKLIYVGNFANVIPPKKEFIPHGGININHESWKHFNETFETRMITLYCYHNLRELSIYKGERK